jgi:soluble lytic murein transglycosylase
MNLSLTQPPNATVSRPYLLKAIIKVESDYNPRAISRKGAKGLMQIMPDTMKALNIANVFDPWENIMGGRAILSSFSIAMEASSPGFGGV